MRAVRIHELGGPDVLRYEEVPAPQPKAGEVLVRVAAAGVNYLDIYYRSGFHWGGHHGRALPYVPGAEASGTVVDLGANVTEVKIGDRVAYGISNGYGSYAELHALPAWHLYKIPRSITFEDAAAIMLQGMTAHYLTHSTYRVKPEDTVLIHAAAGGTERGRSSRRRSRRSVEALAATAMSPCQIGGNRKCTNATGSFPHARFLTWP